MKTSRRLHLRGRAIPRLLIAAALVGSSLVGLASTATAAGGEQGVLLLKGPGSVYAGPDSVASLSVAAGGAASFGVEVKNTGSATAQFNIQVSYSGSTCASTCAPPTAVVSTGSLIVTPLAAGPNGYYTAPIAPGAVAVYTLKITPPKTGAAPGDDFVYYVQLADTAGNPLGTTSTAFVNVTRSKGTGSVDQFVSASGTPANSGKDTTSFGFATAPSVAIDKTFSFTVKLMNDGATPGKIGWQMYTNVACDVFFPLKVTQASTIGSVDVTSAVQGGTYQTATLAHGASVTLTVTGTSLAGGEQCLLSHNVGTIVWSTVSTDAAGDYATDALLFSPAAS